MRICRQRFLSEHGNISRIRVETQEIYDSSHDKYDDDYYKNVFFVLCRKFNDTCFTFGVMPVLRDVLFCFVISFSVFNSSALNWRPDILNY